MIIEKILKPIGYMYHLHRKNFKAYLTPIITPISNGIIKNSVHWIGHATTVINIEDKLIVTDPVTCKFLGQMKRLVKPSLDLSLLHIDYILLTHGHMDHVHYGSLFKLNKDAIVITPKELMFPLKLMGFKNIHGISPNELYKDEHISIKTIKANHAGNRYYFGKPKACNSYFIERKSKKVFFPGDTAFTDTYTSLYADIALMPVGCYKPDEYAELHCTPEQSFEMFKMTKSKTMVPIHYKTFILAQDEDKDTHSILSNINDGSIKIIDIGETVEF